MKKLIRLEVYSAGGGLLHEFIVQDVMLGDVTVGEEKQRLLIYVTANNDTEFIPLRNGMPKFYIISPAVVATRIDVIMGNDAELKDIATLEIRGDHSVAYMRDGEVVKSFSVGGVKRIDVLQRAKLMSDL